MEANVVSLNFIVSFSIARSTIILRQSQLLEITNIFSRSVWKKKFFNREKRREIEFRQKLIDKVNAAEKFNAEVSKLPSNFLPVLNFLVLLFWKQPS